MISGVFVENIPLIRVVVAWGQSVQAPFVILDTGFTQVAGVTKTQIANGDVIEVPVALAVAAMEGVVNYIQVLISESMPLAGISFLSKFGYKASVDCKYRTVALERMI
jgi:predicted aspartyl protease